MIKSRWGVREKTALAVNGVGVVESVTVTVTVLVLSPRGVPTIWPAAFIPKPDGRPDAAHVYGAVPPVAVTWALYGTPAMPPGSEVVAIDKFNATIVMVRILVAVCAGEPESVALKPIGVRFAAAVGVPLICPVAACKTKPVGRVPETTCQEYEPVPPVAANVCVYGEPTAPVASEVVVMESVGGAIVSVRLTLAFCCAGEPESVTLKVSGVALTCALGVPLINPEAAVRVNPAGSVPEVNCQV